MNTTKRYTATPNFIDQSDCSVVFELDHLKFVTFQTEISRFWCGWRELESCHGVLFSAIRHVASHLLSNAIDGRLNKLGLQRCFDDAEGFPRAEEMGLEVVEVIFPDISPDGLDLYGEDEETEGEESEDDDELP